MLTYIDEDNQGGNAYSVWGDGTYVYMACRFDGIRSYYVDGTGHFTFLDVDKQDFAGYLGVWGDGDFIYAACDFDGLRSYGVTLPAPSGELIFKDGDSQSSENPKGIWANDSFVFAACSLDGLRTYSVDGAGVFTALDAHNQTPGESYNAVWSDGNYIYVGSSGDLLSYSVDGAGNLTYRHSVSALFTGYNDVCGDGTYIFSTNMGTTAGLRSHSVADGVLTYLSNVVAGAGLSMHFDGTFIFVATATGLRSFSINSGTGATTLEDTDDQGGIYREVWGDGEFIYAQTDEGIISYSVDGGGNLTFISSNPDGRSTSGEAGLWGDGNFIYTGCADDGIKSFSRDGAGNLTLVDTDDQGGHYGDVYGDGNFVYVCSAENILSYEIGVESPAVDWGNFTGDDFTGNNGDNINSDYWHLVDGYVDDARIQDNKLYFDINKELAYYGSNFKLTGDFDIQINWEYTSAQEYSGVRLGFGDTDDPTTMVNGGYISSDHAGPWKYSGDLKMSGGWEGVVDTNRGENDGQLKITRIGATVRMSYKNADQSFFLLRQRINFSEDDMYVVLAGNTSGGNGCVFTIDDFVINSGTVIGA
jgi:hypothetical protein